MSEDTVNIEVNGVAVKARKGDMIIRTTDENGVYIPRFCYHEKLAVAANCRMCLVEVEKAPKPMPACATPVAEGMKVFTNSPKALGAQKATMEFLLINHPLDCPICDQGGECELQDLALGFGRDVSRYTERKRVVKDENIGPLVSTDMTRCIQCTRCVRFTQEIAGIQELGTIGRGEQMTIRSFVEKTVDHELSGNIIDLCPVGALNSKPFRFRARSWEMTQHALVSPHDGVGTNVYGHVLRGQLMRIVPRTNEAINETWIADRDRFAYEGLYSADRLRKPMIRTAAGWEETSWESALEAAANELKSCAGNLGVLASASATVEELYLLGRIARGLGTNDIDHRLRQTDGRDQADDPRFPSLGGLAIAAVDTLDALLVVGSNLRREVPMLANRVRKAAIRGGRVAFVNPARLPYLFPVAGYVEAGAELVTGLAAVLAAALETAGQAPAENVAALVRAVQIEDTHRAAAAALASGERKAVWLGALALRHPAYADLRALAASLAAVTGASLGVLAEGGNAAGAYLAGAVPHREAGGKPVAAPGRSAREMIAQPRQAYVLFGGIEPWADGLGEESLRALNSARLVVAVTPYASDTLKEVAHVLLPIGTYVESSGTFVNLEGTWQSFAGAARPLGDSRPGWKVLRVLGNLLGLQQFDHDSSEQVRDEVRGLAGEGGAASYAGRHRVEAGAVAARPSDVPMYQVDAIVRRAASLQRTREGSAAAASQG